MQVLLVKLELFMFCKWGQRFKKSDFRNQFVSGCSSMKLEGLKTQAVPSHKMQQEPSML